MAKKERLERDKEEDEWLEQDKGKGGRFERDKEEDEWLEQDKGKGGRFERDKGKQRSMFIEAPHLSAVV